MNNFDKIKEILEHYISNHRFTLDTIEIDLEDASENMETHNKLYKGDKVIRAVDMDKIAKKYYRKIMIPTSCSEDDSINTVDSFLVSKDNEWYFIEFKDTKVNKGDTKANIIKKAYSNVYMLLDIMFEMRKEGETYGGFSYESPIQFIKKNVTYILVCSEHMNPEVYKQIRQQELLHLKYTPPFMNRINDYLFKEAYIYTEWHFEKKFVDCFSYE